jgi:HK97 family phage major capsid protein
MRPQGNANPQAMWAELKGAFDDFKARNDEKLAGKADWDKVQASLDQLSALSASGPVGSVADDRPFDPEYSRTFAGWMRRGSNEDAVKGANATGQRAQIQAAMSAGSNADGGYMAPTEWDRKVIKALAAVSPMRRICDVVPTSVRAFSTLWNTGAWGSGWVGETANRPQTTSATLAPVIFESGEIYAMPAITQQLLDDADFQVEEWLSNDVASTFTKQEDIAFVAGDGVNKPRGFLTYVPGGVSATTHPGGTLAIDVSGAAGALTPDGLIKFVYSLAAPYRPNATWVMNSTTAAAVALLKDGQGNYLWRPSYAVGLPPTLLGFPVEMDENMPGIAPGSTPIAFGDFRQGYVINDRFGTRYLRDPYTAKPYVLIYATKRVGGGVRDPNAIRLHKIAAS